VDQPEADGAASISSTFCTLRSNAMIYEYNTSIDELDITNNILEHGGGICYLRK
jgi:hypothetical protein